VLREFFGCQSLDVVLFDARFCCGRVDDWIAICNNRRAPAVESHELLACVVEDLALESTLVIMRRCRLANATAEHLTCF
jgi:hypothetical protein